MGMQNQYPQPQPPFGPRPMQAPMPNQNQFSGFQGAPNPMNMMQPQPADQQEMKPPLFQSPYEQFMKPPQPNQWNPYYSLEQQFPQYGQMQGPKNGMIQYFQDKNGQLDIDKMLSTMGQVANTANQFSPLVKSLSSFFVK